MTDKFIDSFVIVHNGRIISPVLITTRSYGSWFEQYFDNYTAQLELYLKAKTKDGEQVLEYHPGTKIGQWFDKNTFSDDTLSSWFILQDSNIMYKIVKLKLATQGDASLTNIPKIPEKQRMLRVYTKEQIELYLRTLLKEQFELPISTPKQIKVSDLDLDKLIKPCYKATGRKKLF